MCPSGIRRSVTPPAVPDAEIQHRLGLGNRDLNDFFPGLLPADDAHLGSRDTEVFSQGRDDRGVCQSLPRRSRHRNAKAAVPQRLHARASGLRDDRHDDPHRAALSDQRRGRALGVS